MIKRIAVIIVNYNKSMVTISCVNSMIRSIEACENAVIDLFVIDNASSSEQFEILKNGIEGCRIIRNNENMGYFGAINVVLANLDLERYEYILIGNNDLVFDNLFFKNLLGIKLDSSYGIICPNIITVDGVHQNPHEQKRIPKYRKAMYSLYFKNYYFGQIMYYLKQLLKKIMKTRNRVKKWSEQCDVYLGYGALYIIRPSLIRETRKIEYPAFLMGEEYFIRKKLNESKMKMVYIPSLEVKHLEHASVMGISSKKMYAYSKEAYLEYRKFWNLI